MNIISLLLIACIAVLHFYILWMEMFAWTTVGKKTFKGYPAEYFEKTKVLAANQGLYNGFLAAGLIWSLIITDVFWATNVALFFLVCVTIAGLYGGYSSSKRIIFVQTIPALITIITIYFL
ncbi:MAG: DUF1304 domain-containing protein [Saprospiraceae bacterium]|nr:DUF1304 domain-containing protein [Saprospiraceae bacterium]